MIKISGIILAAGQSTRFGTHKLKVSLESGNVLLETLKKFKTLPLEELIVVVSEETAPLIKDEIGIRPIFNAHPEWGVSHSIKLALGKCGVSEGYLFSVGDQPLMRSETLKGLVEAFDTLPQEIVGLGADGELGNPVIFPRCMLPLFDTLEGDKGGKALIKKQQLPYRIIDVSDEAELWDMDTQADYDKIIRRIQNGIITT